MPKLTLTFDNGPTPGATERILDILKERSLPATFFVIGKNLEDARGRELLQRAADEGHWIGNHTMTHSDPLGLRKDGGHPAQEIGRTQKLLGDLAHPDRLFRPVGGGCLGPHVLSQAAADYLAEENYTVVTWNNVPHDWVEPRRAWVDRALDTMEHQDWTLLVVHDFALETMMDTLTEFLDRAAGANFEIVQDFPESCLPMRRGKPFPSLQDLVMA